MKSKRKKEKNRKNLFLLGAFSLGIITVTVYTTGKYWVEIYDKYQEKVELKEKLLSLKEEEDELQVDADKLQDSDYIARYAREKYSYSKDGEIILKIP